MICCVDLATPGSPAQGVALVTCSAIELPADANTTNQPIASSRAQTGVLRAGLIRPRTRIMGLSLSLRRARTLPIWGRHGGHRCRRCPHRRYSPTESSRHCRSEPFRGTIRSHELNLWSGIYPGHVLYGPGGRPVPRPAHAPIRLARMIGPAVDHTARHRICFLPKPIAVSGFGRGPAR